MPTTLIVTFVGACLLLMGLKESRADALITSWRPLDGVFYKVGCHDLHAARRVAAAGGARSVWMEVLNEGRCFILESSIPARLLEWVAGPYKGDAGEPVSIWRVKDAAGDIEFIVLPDLIGPHLPAKAA